MENRKSRDFAPDELSDMSCCGNDLICGAKMKTYWFFNLVAAFLHFANAVLMFSTYYSNDTKDVCYSLKSIFQQVRPNCKLQWLFRRVGSKLIYVSNERLEP